MQNDIFSMEGKTVVFTGGCGNLGKVMVKALLDYGANVAVPNRTDKFDESYDAYKAAGKLVVIPADLKYTEDTKAAFQKAEEIFGKIDVLVNCATVGAGYGKESQLEYMGDDVWEKGINGGLSSVFRGIREIVPYMKEKGGSIVNYCSMYGVVAPDLRIYGDNPAKQPPNYGAAKAGVQQLTRYAAGALAEYNIRVNCVIPGTFPNPNVKEDPAFVTQLANKTMMGRVGINHEIAGAVLLLASDASSYMTGTSITVDGGWTAW